MSCGISNGAQAERSAGHGACACAPEPTMEEFEGAMREATQNLESVTNDLNERIEEFYDIDDG